MTNLRQSRQSWAIVKFIDRDQTAAERNERPILEVVPKVWITSEDTCMYPKEMEFFEALKNAGSKNGLVSDVSAMVTRGIQLLRLSSTELSANNRVMAFYEMKKPIRDTEESEAEGRFRKPNQKYGGPDSDFVSSASAFKGGSRAEKRPRLHVDRDETTMGGRRALASIPNSPSVSDMEDHEDVAHSQNFDINHEYQDTLFSQASPETPQISLTIVRKGPKPIPALAKQPESANLDGLLANNNWACNKSCCDFNMRANVALTDQMTEVIEMVKKMTALLDNLTIKLVSKEGKALLVSSKLQHKLPLDTLAECQAITNSLKGNKAGEKDALARMLVAYGTGESDKDVARSITKKCFSESLRCKLCNQVVKKDGKTSLKKAFPELFEAIVESSMACCKVLGLKCDIQKLTSGMSEVFAQSPFCVEYRQNMSALAKAPSLKKKAPRPIIEGSVSSRTTKSSKNDVTLPARSKTDDPLLVYFDNQNSSEESTAEDESEDE
ncbi:Hypothetical predicted protein [Cloeon dipterum]|uniref:Uncharacterized protein n=1 Tax=Cloeon dipterum TaxID=197152 RepID=A0A8S1DXA3_9INSE|nr:Hypothetical predicted protein [Cloeon dipterum]